MKYSIIVTGYNCERYAKECIDSILNQTYKNFEILIYNDASTDDTAKICKPYTDSKNVWLWNNKVNQGACFGRYHLNKLASGDVVCFVGLDDYLPENCLETLNRYYEDENCLMTYGSWKSTRGKVFQAKEYSNETWATKNFRRDSWKATALQTFKKELLDKVPTDYLMMNGDWIDNCTDLAFGFPCLEMVNKEQCKVVKETIYIYRDDHANTTRGRLGLKHKAKIREHLKRQPKCEL